MNAKTVALGFLCFLLAACTAVESDTVRKVSAPDKKRQDSVTLSGAQVQNVKISTARVEQKVMPCLVHTGGQVEADANMTTPVNSPEAGRIEEVEVRLGDTIKVGQLLATLRSDDVAQLESDLLKNVLDIEADREQNKVELELGRTNYLRKKTLFEQGVAAKADFEAAVHDYEKAKAALASLESKRTAAITSAAERLRLYGVQAKNEVDRVLSTQTIDNKFEIRAPRAGVLTARDVNHGQLVDTAKALFVISDLSKVWLVARVFENNIGKIKVGQPVEVAVDSFPGKTFAGKIDYVAPNVDPATRAISVRATVENEHQLLKPQMFARMSIRVGSSPVLVVPQAAIQKTGEVDIAYVPLPENRFEERKLVLGAVVGRYVAIKSGLKRGEDVVVNGSVELNGQAIQQQESEQ